MDIFDPYEKHHSTVKDACELAEKLNVENLIQQSSDDAICTSEHQQSDSREQISVIPAGQRTVGS